MSEKRTQHESNLNFTAFYGTTLENFLRCAHIDSNGRVLFSKSLEPQYTEPETTQLVYGLSGGANYAVTRARELGHTPLVLEGEFDRQRYFYKQELFPGEAFPVNNAWVPQNGTDWKNYNPFADNFDPDEKETKRAFQSYNPAELLEAHTRK